MVRQKFTPRMRMMKRSSQEMCEWQFTTHPFLLLYHLAAAILGDVKMQASYCFHYLFSCYTTVDSQWFIKIKKKTQDDQSAQWHRQKYCLIVHLGFQFSCQFLISSTGRKVKSSMTLKISPERLSEEHAFELAHASSLQGLTATDEHVY